MHPLLSHPKPPKKAATGGFLNVLGPQIDIRTALDVNDDDYCLIEAVFPAGSVVPLHTHERETFFVLAGSMQGYRDGRWHELTTGEVFDVLANVRHALRNTSGKDVSLLVVTTMRVGRFLREIGRPADTVPPGPPSAEDVARFVQVAHAYGYWLGEPEENAAIGLPVEPR